MDATVTLEQGMAFLGTADTGFTIKMDAHPSVGGDNDGFRPLELLLLGLGGCTGMDVISILRKKKQAISGFEVQLHADRAKDIPHVFTEVTINFIVRGRDINPTAVERAIELSATKYCSAQAMLEPSVEITSSYKIVEEA